MVRVWHTLARVSTLGLRILNAANCALRRGERPTRIRTLLVVKLDAIGDFVLSTPFLRELRGLYPDASITLVVQPASFGLAQTCPYINRVIKFDPSASSAARREFLCVRAALLGLKFWPSGYDMAIIPRWDSDGYKGYHIVCGSGARHLVAYRRTLESVKAGWLRRIETRKATKVENGEAAPEVTQNLRLLETLGARIASDRLELWLTSEDRERAAKWLHGLGGSTSGPLIALGIGASIPRKCWAEDRFVSLSAILARQYDARIVLVGAGKADLQRAETILKLGGNLPIYSAVGAFSLRETAAFLELTQLFVGNDSGPMHLAAAVGVSVVQLFGISEGDDPSYEYPALRFGPWKVPGRVIRPPELTGTARRDAAGRNPFRMELIAVDTVANAIAELLDGRFNQTRNVLPSPTSGARR